MMNINKDISFIFDSLRQFLLTFITVNILFFSGMVQSSIVYSQLPLDGADGASSFFEEHSADNFLLPVNKRITGVQWFGSFTDSGVSNNIFDIRFFADDGGLPGTLISESLSVSATRSMTGLTDIVGAEVFRFSSSISSVLLLENTIYYLSIVHPEDAVDDEFYWILNNNENNNFTRNTNVAVDNSWKVGVSAPGNLSFNIVPEPSAPLLLMMAFMLLGVYRGSISV